MSRRRHRRVTPFLLHACRHKGRQRICLRIRYRTGRRYAEDNDMPEMVPVLPERSMPRVVGKEAETWRQASFQNTSRPAREYSFQRIGRSTREML